MLPSMGRPAGATDRAPPTHPVGAVRDAMPGAPA